MSKRQSPGAQRSASLQRIAQVLRRPRPGLAGPAGWLLALAAALLFTAAPAAAATSDARVDAITAKLDAASLFLCENIAPDGTVSTCGGEISIVESKRYDAWARNGRISLTRRMIERSTDDELAFVIAHEMAHVILGHPGSSRKNELAADYWAARMMFRSGYNAQAAEQVLARLQTRRMLGFPFSMFSHPANSRRMRAIRQALDEETTVAIAAPALPPGTIASLAVSALP